MVRFYNQTVDSRSMTAFVFTMSASGFEVARTKLVIQIQAGANQKYMVRQNQSVARVPMAAHEVDHKQTEGGTQPTGRTHVALHIQGAARREQNAAHTQGAALAELMMARSSVVLTYRIGCLVPCRLMFHSPLLNSCRRHSVRVGIVER